MIVVPIGFVSDHVEVVWDLDNEAAETAAAHDLFFARVGTPGTDPRFVSALADLVEERLDQADFGRDSADVDATCPVPTCPDPTCPDPVTWIRRRPDFCAAGCCVNSMETRPTTAAVDSAADWNGVPVDPAKLAASGIRGTVQG